MLRLIYFVYFIHFPHKTTDDWYKRIVVRLANVTLCWFYKITGDLTNQRKVSQVGGRNEVIVSLTSYPVRINKVWLAVETILDQSVKPKKVILWLSRDEFNTVESIPDNLKALKNRGLEIRFCDENLLPHKKYFYAMQEFPDSLIITIDDDMLYHPDMIKNLLSHHEHYPKAVCCSISREIKIRNNEVRPYSEWECVKDCTEPTHKNHLMGGGGTLYPSGSLHPELFNISALKKLARITDDLWLKIMSLKQNTKVASVAGYYRRSFIPLIHKHDSTLMSINIGQNNNNKSINKLMEHYKIDYKWFVG